MEVKKNNPTSRQIKRSASDNVLCGCNSAALPELRGVTQMSCCCQIFEHFFPQKIDSSSLL